jgi:secondary thiamine-phosphate synthase enzyme
MPRTQLAVNTAQRRQVIDLTGQVQTAVASLGVTEGLACISVQHCTCALYVNENESGLLADTLRLVEELTSRGGWQHDRIDDNAAAHLAASLLGPSVVLPVEGGEVVLGTWQRILLLELDGPRRRTVTVSVVGG